MPLAILLLGVLWTWNRDLTNCFGGPVVTHHYYFQATIRQNVPATCYDDESKPYDCQATIPLPPVPFGPDFPDPGSGTDVCTSFDPADLPDLLPDVPAGGLAAWPWEEPVVAVDAAGNKSGPCP